LTTWRKQIKLQINDLKMALQICPKQYTFKARQT
jgi:hypothetical protein